MAGLRTIVGGEIPEYTQLLEEARRHALDRMVQNATIMGANAILMMRYDSAGKEQGRVGAKFPWRSSLFMVCSVRRGLMGGCAGGSGFSAGRAK